MIPVVAGIGNALLAVPMVRRLKRALPGCRISVLALIEPMADVFRRLPEVDEVIVTGKGAKGLWRMVRASRRRRADVFLVPFPSNRWQYALLALLSGARRRVMHGYPVGYFAALHFLPADRLPAERHVHDVRQNLNLLTMLGIAAPADEPPVFPLTDTDRGRAGELLRGAGVPDRARPIVVHAGSARTVLARAKRWPPALYAELIRAVALEGIGPVVVVEGPDEAGVADDILQHLERTDSRGATASPAAGPIPSRAAVAADTPRAADAPRAAGDTGDPREPSAPRAVGAAGGARATAVPHVVRLTGPLAEAAAVLERAALYVGSDSGLAHLAAAVGTPAVTLFAPADPDRVCPFGNRDRVVQAPVPCAPCAQYPWHAAEPKVLCTAPYCIERISVEQVVAKVRDAKGTAGVNAWGVARAGDAGAGGTPSRESASREGASRESASRESASSEGASSEGASRAGAGA
ncbi:MAG TPA: glycosyltransferase family 9 protein [Tepidisphaeraceae bacterium]|nr:glycosyltransferase family 9 protein [Tepidisphaeraceae bacterium]